MKFNIRNEPPPRIWSKKKEDRLLIAILLAVLISVWGAGYFVGMVHCGL